jgi:hypothetical protein
LATRARWSRRLARTSALTLLLVAGCSSFQDVTSVVDLRILGIKADPAEIYVDPSTLDSRTDPFVSDMTALVIDPKGGGRPVQYSVLACPRAIDTVTAATGRNGVICEHNVPGATPTSLELVPPDAPLSTSDPGPEHDIPLHFSVPPSLLQLAFTVDPVAASEGFQLPVTVQFELAAGTESIVATKRMIFSQAVPGHPEQAANMNPVVSTVNVYPSRDAQARPIGSTVLAENDTGTVPLGGHLWFQPDGGGAESYFTRILTRDSPPQVTVNTDGIVETLRFAYFTDAGVLAPPTTSTEPSPLFTTPDGVIHLESQYTAPTVMPANPLVNVWIVVRDERGGASWTKRQIQLVPSAP